MIRFVEIEGTGFGWYNTVTDNFLTYAGVQSWIDWDDFKEDYSEINGSDLDRLWGLYKWKGGKPEPLTEFQEIVRDIGLDQHMKKEQWAGAWKTCEVCTEHSPLQKSYSDKFMYGFYEGRVIECPYCRARKYYADAMKRGERL